MEGDRYLRCDTNTAAIVHSATSIQSSIKVRAGSGFSDMGISGFRARARRDRRDEVHEEAET